MISSFCFCFSVSVSFFFSKKLPEAKDDSEFLKAPKAMNFLLIVTVLLTACFYFMFAEYQGDNPEPNDFFILKLTILSLIFVIGGLLLSNVLAKKDKEKWGAMQYPQLVLGMIAIFIYVGVHQELLFETHVNSNIIKLAVNEIKYILNVFLYASISQICYNPRFCYQRQLFFFLICWNKTLKLIKIKLLEVRDHQKTQEHFDFMLINGLIMIISIDF